MCQTLESQGRGRAVRLGRRDFAKAGRGISGMVAMVVLFAAGNVFAGADYDTYGNYIQAGSYTGFDANDTDNAAVHYQSSSSGVGSGLTLTNGESYAAVSLHAAADTLNQGFHVGIMSTPNCGSLSDVRVNTSVANSWSLPRARPVCPTATPSRCI